MTTETKGVSIYDNWIEFISEQDTNSLTTEFLVKLLQTQKEDKFPESSDPKLSLLFKLYAPSFITNLDRYTKKGNDISQKKDVLIFNNWIEALIKLEPESVATNLLVNIANILNGHSYTESGVFEIDVFLSHIQSSMAKTIANRTRKSSQPRFNLNPTNIQVISKPEPNHIQTVSKVEPSNIQVISKQYPSDIQTISKQEPSNIQMPIGNRERIKVKDIGNKLEDNVKDISDEKEVLDISTSFIPEDYPVDLFLDEEYIEINNKLNNLTESVKVDNITTPEEIQEMINEVEDEYKLELNSEDDLWEKKVQEMKASGVKVKSTEIDNSDFLDDEFWNW